MTTLETLWPAASRTGDKAYGHEEELTGLRDPHVAVHGSFSFMVNFHAVKVYVTNRGGFSLHTPYQDGFKCSAFLVGFGEEELPELRYAWADCMETFGPDNFSTLQRCIKDETPNPSAKLAISVIRMSNYDSDVFFKFKQVCATVMGEGRRGAETGSRPDRENVKKERGTWLWCRCLSAWSMDPSHLL